MLCSPSELCVFSSSTNNDHLIIVSCCHDGCTASRGSAFKQLTSVNKSDWHMSEAAPCSVAAVPRNWNLRAERGCCCNGCACMCVYGSVRGNLHVCKFTREGLLFEIISIQTYGCACNISQLSFFFSNVVQQRNRLEWWCHQVTNPRAAPLTVSNSQDNMTAPTVILLELRHSSQLEDQHSNKRNFDGISQTKLC